MHRWLQRVWYDDAASGIVLRPLSWLFALLVALRRILYRVGLLHSHAVGKPVIVIGNLTVGGTGKTPLTVWLAQHLHARGLKPGIVTRGYKRQGDTPRIVTAQAAYEEVGDEALLLARRSGCPVAVGADRVATARLLIGQGVDVILADDGLQHLALERDFEIAVVDGARRFGNGRLLPAGPLREPAGRLTEVDAVIVNGVAASAGEIPMSLRPGDAVPLAGGASRQLRSFADGPVHAVAGIGNPERFFKMLEAAGLQVIRHAYRDHQALQHSDIVFGDGRAVLMTEKDAVKCEGFAGPEHWFVPVDAVIPPNDAILLLQKALNVRCPLTWC
jgi:tetraacyldisaccharide 4'-kinase